MPTSDSRDRAGSRLRLLRLVAPACLGLLALLLSVLPSHVYALSPGHGTFSVALTGTAVNGDVDFSGEQFTFRYLCWGTSNGPEASGVLEVPGDGTAVTSPELKAGLECTITMDDDDRRKLGYKSTSPIVNRTALVVDGQNTPLANVLTFEAAFGTLYVTKVAELGPYIPPAEPSALEVPDSCEEVTSSASGLLIVDPSCVSGARVRTVGAWTATAATAATAQDALVRDAVLAGTATADLLTGSVVVSYTCTVPGQAAPLTGTANIAVNAGPVAVVTVPVGTVCTVTEDADSARRPGYSLATNYSRTTVTVNEWDGYMAIYNNYVPLVSDSALTVSMTVDGNAAALAPAEFVVDYACADAAGQPTVSGSVTLAAGASQTVQVPAGTCTVTERDASVPGADLTTTMTTAAGTVTATSTTVAVAGDAAAVAVTNTYTRLASETPSATPSESASATPSESASASPSESASAAPSESATASESASATPSESASAAPSESATASESASASPSESASESVVPSVGASSPGVVRAPAGGSTSGSSVSGGSSLARTGASVVVPGVLAVVALGGGGVLLRRRRRA